MGDAQRKEDGENGSSLSNEFSEQEKNLALATGNLTNPIRVSVTEPRGSNSRGSVTKVLPTPQGNGSKYKLGTTNILGKASPSAASGVAPSALISRTASSQNLAAKITRGSVALISSLPTKRTGNADNERIAIVHEDEHSEHFRYVLGWDDPYRRAWDIFIVCAVIYLCFTVPLTIAFIDMEFPSAVGTFLDTLFWIDIILNFRTGFIEHGLHIKDPKHIAAHYFKSWFFIDFVASIPFELILAGSFDKSTRKSLKILKWLKFPKLLRVGRIFKYLKSYVRYYRIVVLSAISLLWLHLDACMWCATVVPCDIYEDSVIGTEFQLSKANCSQKEMWGYYILSLRVSFLMMLHVTDPFSFLGYIDRGVFDDKVSVLNATGPSVGGSLEINSSEWSVLLHSLNEGWSDWTLMSEKRGTQTLHLELLTFFGMILGLLLLANFFAEAVVFAGRRMHGYNQFYNKVEKYKEEMDLLRIPLKTQYRVKRYYDYLYINRKQGLNDGRGSILKDGDLSTPLRKELALFVHGRLLSGLSLFKDCSSDCLVAIALRLKTHVYLPGDAIFRKGEVARELYFIRKGLIAVAFGEIDAFKARKDDGARSSLQNLHGAPLKSKGKSHSEAMADKDDESEFKMDTSLNDSSTVKIMGPGSFFGEIALLTCMPRSCSVFSKTVSELNELSKADFEDVMLEYPELSHEVAEQVMIMYPGLRDKVEMFLSEHEQKARGGEKKENPRESKNAAERLSEAFLGTASFKKDLLQSQPVLRAHTLSMLAAESAKKEGTSGRDVESVVRQTCDNVKEELRAEFQAELKSQLEPLMKNIMLAIEQSTRQIIYSQPPQDSPRPFNVDEALDQVLHRENDKVSSLKPKGQTLSPLRSDQAGQLRNARDTRDKVVRKARDSAMFDVDDLLATLKSEKTESEIK